MTEKHKIGIYGGTFSPPHIAHVKACEAFYNKVLPEKLMVIPDFLPPHKELDGGADTVDRFEMAKLAFAHIPSVIVSDIEIQRGGRSYTAVTLGELAGEDKELYLLCGTDMFLTLDTWYRPDIIFSLATICYVRRESYRELDVKISLASKKYLGKYNAKLIPIELDAIELSSSEIRNKIKNGVDVSDLIPEKVSEYINRRGIYK